jgi:nucleotide-binding universal stress UspA family protein
MYKKILVPLDGSELSECTLPHVESIAIAQKVPEVILLRVVEPMSSIDAAGYTQVGGDVIPGIRKKYITEIKEYLGKVEQRLKQKGISAKSVVLEGPPAEEILRYAGKENVDLIIIATHGKTGISRFLFGSVAEKVSRHAKMPVQLITPSGCRRNE